MKPANGTHVLVYPTQPGVSCTIVVDDTGANTPYGRMAWVPDPPPGLFVRLEGTPEFEIEFTTPTTGRAVLGSMNLPFTWS